MKYYIIAGEASGDLHGSNLIKQLHRLDGNANIRCWGGPMMRAAGATVVKDYKELAFMGFVEVIMNLTTILKNIKFCKKDIQQWVSFFFFALNHLPFYSKQHQMEQINIFCGTSSILVLNAKGVGRIYCPFKVECLDKLELYQVGQIVSVTAVKMSPDWKLVYVIGGKGYYHYHFKIISDPSSIQIPFN